jgi:hypothetical protein
MKLEMDEFSKSQVDYNGVDHTRVSVYIKIENHGKVQKTL